MKNNTNPSVQSSSRRHFLKSAATAGGLLSSATLAPATALAGNRYFSQNPFFDEQRAWDVFEIRLSNSRSQLLEALQLPEQTDNNDHQRYRGERFYASFSKTLPHNRYGEVNPGAYRRLVRALKSGRSQDFDNIPLAQRATVKLANPQGCLRIPLTGSDSHTTRIAAAPSFRSAETAAEIGEVYWLAHTRDIAYKDYASHTDIANAINDLNQFSKTVGPTLGGQVTSETLFRGETPGDLVGPYISQLLFHDIPYGPSLIEQRYALGVNANNFMLDEANWLNIQRGGTPQEAFIADTSRRYIYNNRGLAEYVHNDVLFQAYFNAAMILLQYGPEVIDSDNPYSSEITNQGGFTSFGGPFLFDLLTQASNLALSGAWFQKWRIHRRLRPEVFCGRVHFHLKGLRQYELHSDILDSQAVARSFSDYGSYFLPMAYIEGSPTHPAYPAGHATVAGACCTILKAFFNEDFVLPNPVEANRDGTALVDYAGSDLTAGGEINKLAANISLGRDAAGVHYRSDGIEGILAGEQQALGLLQDYSMTTSESFAGFKLKRFNGERVRIVDGNIISA